MSKYTIMFVDIIGSTNLKHQHDRQDAFDVTMWLFHMIREIAAGSAKFTGDGGMIVFPEYQGGSRRAILAAEKIIQEVDGLNLAFKRVAELERTEPRDPTPKDPRTGHDLRLQVRIGIATGTPTKINDNPLDVVGTEADLAARLCTEADPDGILVDQNTKNIVTQEVPELQGRFKECLHRLQLKGIPKTVDGFYHFFPDRLVGKPADGPYVGGILALFAHRNLLIESFPEGRILELAAEGSELLVAGRTLKFWATKIMSDHSFLKRAGRKKLKMSFLMSSQSSCKYLDKSQVKTIRRDRPQAVEVFRKVRSSDASVYGFEFKVRETSHLFLDGLVYAEIELPGKPRTVEKTRIVLQDINATDSDVQMLITDKGDDPKATLLLACICNQDLERRKYCKVCGLYDRTLNIYNNYARDLQ